MAQERVGGLVGELVHAQMERSFAAVHIPSGLRRGGAVGYRDDHMTSSIDSNPPIYLCTGTTAIPTGSSLLSHIYYDRSRMSPDNGGGGSSLATSEMYLLHGRANLDRSLWEQFPQRYPVLRHLPRSTLAND